MGKVSKSGAGYQFRPSTNYTCGECVFLKPIKGGHGCAFFGPGESVSDKSGSCIYFSHGKPDKYNIPFMGLFTKEELGYEENGPGFTCGRCEEFIVPGDCMKVDKNSPGDTPGKISAGGCCSLWEKDSKRGGMSDKELVQLIAKSGPTLGPPDQK